jgi:threonine dehydratase
LNTAWSDIQEAQRFLRDRFQPTRLAYAESLSRNRAPVYLKLETELPTGSFKVRGAVFALHAEMQRGNVKEVVAASTGNHGAAVAYAAKALGAPATIFLPSRPNPVKRGRIQELGATVVEEGKDISEAVEHARAYAARTPSFLLDDATDPRVPAGTATIGSEIAQQLPNVGAIWVPMGDTALIRGIATAVKSFRPGIRVVGVQAELAPAYYLSWKRGVVVRTDTCNTIADGLATRDPIEENVAAIRALVDDVRLVTEQQMIQAIRHLRTNEQIVAEPAAAAAAAAWMADATGLVEGPSVLLVTGANISPDLLQQLTESS